MLLRSASTSTRARGYVSTTMKVGTPSTSRLQDRVELEDLERARAVEPAVACEVDAPRRATAEELLDPVARDPTRSFTAGYLPAASFT